MKLKLNTALAILFWFAVFLISVLDSYLQSSFGSGVVHITTTVVLTGILFAWFLADAQSINYKPSGIMKIGVVALGIISIPIYLIKAKGIKRSGISLLKFTGFITLVFLMLFLVEYSNA